MCIRDRHWCVDDSLRSSDVVIAADLFLLYYKLYPSEKLDKEYAAKIISALSFANPLYDHIYIIKYLELSQLFETRHESLVLTSRQTSIFTNKALSIGNSPVLSHRAMERILDSTFLLNGKLRDDQIRTAYKLISENYKINNPTGIFFTWLKIKDHYSNLEDHGRGILYMIFKSCTQNRSYRMVCKEMLSRLSPQFYCNDPLLLPSIIDYCTTIRSLNSTKTLMEDINKYTLTENYQIIWFTRRCLSSLLKMHLQFNDADGVDRTLKQINEKFGDHSQENYVALVSYFLNTEKLENIARALKLVNSIPQKNALLSYGIIINKLIDWQIAKKRIFTKNASSIINDLLSKAHSQDPQHHSSLWNVVAALYFKRLLNLEKITGDEKNTKIVNQTSACLIYTSRCV